MNQEKIGNFLSVLRKEHNYTQEEVADRLNVNVKSVSRWENGRNLPDHSVIVEICKFYNVSINEFYNGERIKKTIKVKYLILFYLVVSFTSLFVLPILGIVAPTLIICAFIIPIGAFLDLVFLIFTGNDIPQIVFQFGNLYLHPFFAFPVAVILSIILFWLGMRSWNLLIKYIKFIILKREKIYNDL